MLKKLEYFIEKYTSDSSNTLRTFPIRQEESEKIKIRELYVPRGKFPV